MIFQESRCRFPGDVQGFCFRVAKDACRNEGKGDGLAAVRRCQRQGRGITAGQQVPFSPLAALPNGTDGVDDVFRLQSVTVRQYLLPRRAGRLGQAGFLEFPGPRPDSVENGPADTAAGEKARIGCIDDSIRSHLDNIAVNDRKCHENPSLSEKANTYLYVRT